MRCGKTRSFCAVTSRFATASRSSGAGFSGSTESAVTTHASSTVW